MTKSQESTNNNILRIIRPPSASTQTVKRKVGYDEENEEQIEVARMDLKRVNLHAPDNQDSSSD